MSYSFDKSLLHLVHRAAQVSGDIFAAEQELGDLTPRQFVVLAAVANDEGLSQTGIVEKTGIDRSTLADIVRRLQRRGLLSRKRTKEDARAYAVKVTAQGQELLEQTIKTVQRTERRLLAALPASSRDDLMTLLHQLTDVASSRSKQT
jgi:DNA-binding MarR family transcriptional regulator